MPKNPHAMIDSHPEIARVAIGEMLDIPPEDVDLDVDRYMVPAMPEHLKQGKPLFETADWMRGT